MNQLYLRLCLFLLFLLSHPVCQAAKFPSIKSVVRHYLSNYEFGKTYPTLLWFAKTKDGWYTYEMKTNSQAQMQNKQLFWSAKSGQFVKLSYKVRKNQKPTEAETNELLGQQGSLYDFDRLPFYGYPGYDQDIIKEYEHVLKSEAKATETQLEALGRAYNNLAQNMWMQIGLHNPHTGLEPVRNGEEISEKHISKFIEYEKLAIQAYGKLARQNPSYETRAGNIRTKSAHEHMFAYISLCIAGRKKEARYFLKDSIYSPLELAYGRNILSSLKQDAVYFVDGDASTYIPWYIQEKFNERQHVNIINITMLSLPRYILAIRDGFMSQRPVPITFPEHFVTHKMPDYVLVDPEGSFSATLPDGSTTETEESDNDEGYYSRNYAESDASFQTARNALLDRQHFYVSGEDTMTVFRFSSIWPSLNRYNEYQFQRDIYKEQYMVGGYAGELHYEANGSYILTRDLLIMDIIDGINWTRPVYFHDKDAMNGFSPYMQDEGHVFRLTSYDITYNTAFSNIYRTDTAKLAKAVLQDWNFRGAFDFKPVAGNLNVELLDLLRRPYYLLAVSYLAHRSADSAAMVLDKCLSDLPNSKVPLLGMGIYLSDLYRQAGQHAKARKVLSVSVSNLLAALNRVSSSGMESEASKKLEYTRFLTDAKFLNDQFIKDPEIAAMLKTAGAKVTLRKLGADKKISPVSETIQYSSEAPSLQEDVIIEEEPYPSEETNEEGE